MQGKMGQSAILNIVVNLGDIEQLFEQRCERDVNQAESRATTFQTKESASANAIHWKILGTTRTKEGSVTGAE